MLHNNSMGSDDSDDWLFRSHFFVMGVSMIYLKQLNSPGTKPFHIQVPIHCQFEKLDNHSPHIFLATTAEPRQCLQQNWKNNSSWEIRKTNTANITLNILRPGWNGQNFADDISNEFYWKLPYFDSNFTDVCTKGPISNRSALVQIMSLWQTGTKLLLEPMMTKFYDAIWVTRQQ